MTDEALSSQITRCPQFHKLEDFSLSYSRVANAHGKFYIETTSHLYDFALWTRAFSISSDHAMLFSSIHYNRAVIHCNCVSQALWIFDNR
ncbi:hypothetical protein CHS0354_013302 [Potamilus streckersoni]|uniref:Uncharacterized protein n=1 Tax=Potamilus streckersoni TaxID=2493646 RepID=A0AAE0SZE7_9BIVA|nr:hypothetical protein CHS0354_013302 [Potamilus streckersoni]